MKTAILAAVVAALSATTATAGGGPVFEPQPIYDPSFFVGLAWTFGNDGGTAGVTVKYLSTNHPDKIALGGGLTYNFNGTFGCDVGAGYSTDGFSGVLSYDFCQAGPQISLGFPEDHGTELVCVQNCIQ